MSHVQYVPSQQGTAFVKHPNVVVESDALASVPSPTVDYKHSLHKQAEDGTLSSIQTETIVLACAQVDWIPLS